MKAVGLIFLFPLFLAGCSGCMEPPPESPRLTPTNIVVILDTSNRVSKAKHPNQAQKDIRIAQVIVAHFKKQVSESLYIESSDRLSFVVPRQPNTVPINGELADRLRLWQTQESSLGGKPVYENREADLKRALEELYQFVETRNEFTGSDIWDWFRSSAEGYLKQGMDNYIICVSDGYLDFDANIQHNRIMNGNKTSYIPNKQIVAFRQDLDWEQVFDAEGHGLLEIGKDFSVFNVRFLMVEMELRHMGDYAILVKYWDSWLQSMGVADPQFERTENGMLAIAEKIREFNPNKIRPRLCLKGEVYKMPRITEIESLMFPVELRPVYYMDTGIDGIQLQRNIPNSRVVVNKKSGKPFGVVSNSYQLVTNEKALEMGKRYCAYLFGADEAANIKVFKVDAPSTGSYCHIDLLHRDYFMNLWGTKAQPDIYVPYLRVTNSYNTSRALRFDIGFCRTVCLNGVIFTAQTIRLEYSHVKHELSHNIPIALEKETIANLVEDFKSHMNKLRNYHIPRAQAFDLLLGLFRIKDEGTNQF